jgi:hypothetical protein
MHLNKEIPMKPRWLILGVLCYCLSLAGCQGGGNGPGRDQTTDASGADQKGGEAKIQAALAKLPAEDRKEAETQKYCAVQNGNRLGQMGTPVKLLVKGQPVFVCCDHCKEEALADEDKTLAKVKELKAKNSGSKTR